MNRNKRKNRDAAAAGRKRRTVRLESLEKRSLLAAWVTETFQTELFFDQFSGGDAKVFHHGYDKHGNEDPEFFGLDLCKAASCGGKPIEVGNYPDAFSIGATAEIELKLGVEYGVYANAGSASLDYDGRFNYQVIDRGDGPIQIATSLTYDSGALFTQSPTAEAFADLVLIADANVSGGACAFGGCVDGTLDFPRIEERVELIGLNRGKSGQIDLIGTSLIEQGMGVYDRVAGGRKDQQEGRRDEYKAERDRKLAKTESERNQAAQDRQNALNRQASGAAAENDAKTAASNSAKGKKFGGGQIFQMSFGEDPGDLLGAELELSVGTGINNAANISKRLGSLSVTVPDIALADTTLGPEDALSAETDAGDTRGEIANLSLDLGAIVGGGFGLGETSVEVGPLEIGLTTVSYDLDTSLRLNQEVNATPNEKLRFEFSSKDSGAPISVDALVNGVPVTQVTSLEFHNGDDVRITPLSNQAVIVTPSLLPVYEFSNDMGLDLDITGTLRALELALSGLGLDEVWGPLIEIETPLADFDLGSIFEESFDVSADPITFPTFEIGGPQSDVTVDLGKATAAYRHDVTTVAPLEIMNRGPDPAENVVVQSRVPDELVIDASLLPDGCHFDGATLTCMVPSLAVNEEVSFDITMTPDVRIATAVRLPFDASSNSRDPEPYETAAELFVQKAFRITTIRTGDGFAGETDYHYNFRKRECEERRNCGLRSAIEFANRNPGPDLIVLNGYGDYTLQEPVTITDTVTIVGREGSFIRPESVSPFFLLHNADPEWTIDGAWAADNGTDADVPVNRVIRDLNNAGSIWVPGGRARYPIVAEAIEGTGRGLIPFDENRHLSLQADEFQRNGSEITAIFRLPGDNNDFKITLSGRVGQDPDASVAESFALDINVRRRDRHELLRFEADDRELTIHGIGLKEGNADQGDSPGGAGGAINVRGTGNTLNLRHTRFENNVAGLGAGIFMQEGDLNIDNVYFIDNSAFYRGGAIAVENVNVNIQDSFFLRNDAPVGPVIAADVFGATTSISANHTMFLSNTVGESSGAIEVSSYTDSFVEFQLQNSTFSGPDQPYVLQTPGSDGDFDAVSLGGNLLERAADFLNPAIDRVGSYFDLDSLHVPVGKAGAVVGNLRFDVPGFVYNDQLELHLSDPRFEIVSGVLRLKEGVVFSEAEPSTTITVTAKNSRGDSVGQFFELSGLGLPRANSFTATATGPDSIQFHWTASSEASHYRLIEVDQDGAEQIIKMVDSSETSVERNGYAPGASFRFMLEAVNASGTDRSGIREITMPVAKPGLVQNAVIEVLSPTSMEVSWEAAEFASSYHVYLDGVLLSDLPRDADRFFISNLIPEQEVEVVVVAKNSSGESALKPRTIRLPPEAPKSPVGFDTGDGSADRVTLTWDAVLDAGEYRIFQSVDGAKAEEIALLPGDATHLEVANLEAGRHYEFELRVYNRSGAARSLTIGGDFAESSDVQEIVLHVEGPETSPAEIIDTQYAGLESIRLRGDQSTVVALDGEQFDAVVADTNELSLHLEPNHDLELGQGWQNGTPVVQDGQFFRVLVLGDRSLKLDRVDAYHNPVNQFDVDSSGVVTALDAILIINRLGDSSGILQPPGQEGLSNDFRFIDVTGDLRASALDALRVINELARVDFESEGFAAVDLAMVRKRVLLNDIAVQEMFDHPTSSLF